MTETRIVGFQDCETAISLPKEAIAQFCDQWKINELYLFGSILRQDFRVDSDVDMMIRLSEDAEVGLFELVAMKRELETLFSRKVDILTIESIEGSDNPIRRRAILNTMRLLYAS